MQDIYFLRTEYTTTKQYRTAQFEFREERPCRWLQRLALFILRKLGCYASFETVATTRVPFDPPKFAQKLYEQNSELLGQYHLRGERLLIGAEDYAKMMGSEEFYQDFSFTAPYNYCERGNQPPTCYGMKVTVIPWMRGLLTVPKGFSEEKVYEDNPWQR